MKCPPRLIAAPDLPVPFAPELESYCRPNSQRIEAAVDQMVRETLMEATLFKMPLYLPAQGATEIEATIIEWHVAEGDRFRKGQVAGADRQREVGVRFRGPLRRAGDSASVTSRARPCR